MIGPEDDSLHDAGGSPYWAENARFPICVPERLVGGWVMLAHRPPMAHTLGGLALWDPAGAGPHDCLFHDWGQAWAWDPAWDVHDCALPNRLTVETLKPLETFHISYLRDECQADLTWVAVAEPVSVGPGSVDPGSVDPGSVDPGSVDPGSVDPGSVAPISARARGGRFEQAGRLTGTVAVRGDILHVDCWSVRDRWWGPAGSKAGSKAGPRPGRRTDAPYGFDEDGNGFGLHVAATAEPAHDPVEGTTEQLVSGWHRADDVTRPLVSGTRRVPRRAEDGRPLRVEIRGEDDLGRALEADGECVSWLRWSGSPGAERWWSTVRWRLRDRPAWGEVRESTPLELSRRYHRSRRR